MKLLLVDNYDSFSNNIYHFLCLAGLNETVKIVPNDAVDFLESDEFHDFDSIILSPGPGNVFNQEDIGICAPILMHDPRPIFGVCLGHQAIAHYAGARVQRAEFPVHGQVHKISHDGTGLFKGLPDPLEATRYHSWVVDKILPDTLQPVAYTDNLLMSLRHKTLPRWGVQFHPEAIGTTHGVKMFENFLNETQETSRLEAQSRIAAPLTLTHKRLGAAVDPALLCETAQLAGKNPVLLESAMVEDGVSRFSYIGVSTGLGDSTMSFDQRTHMTTIEDEDGQVSQTSSGIFEILKAQQIEVAFEGAAPAFDFHGGAIGWFGYEMKSESGPVVSPKLVDYPGAVFRVTHSYLVVDHKENVTYAATCAPVQNGEARQVSFNALSQVFETAQATTLSAPQPISNQPLVFVPRHSSAQYLAKIEECRDQIRDGESYELCLTNTLETQASVTSWDFYKTLRKSSPAPFAAYLPLTGVTVCSSSPERFLKVDADGAIEAKPIKGTSRRGATAQEDEALKHKLQTSKKERAENMMIVDLLRHDIGSVSQIGSVHVPKLNDIETFTSVHQMVSTIRGRLMSDRTSVDAIKACFPGGSMTGAPKRRSMEILDRLEQHPRGVYSGALGWIGFDGMTDLSIVIRTAVFHDDTVTIGCGGAITYPSDAEEELAEIKLKSRALCQAMSMTHSGDPQNFIWQEAPEKTEVVNRASCKVKEEEV